MNGFSGYYGTKTQKAIGNQILPDFPRGIRIIPGCPTGDAFRAFRTHRSHTNGTLRSGKDCRSGTSPGAWRRNPEPWRSILSGKKETRGTQTES